MVRIISDLVGDWRQLDERIETLIDEISAAGNRPNERSV
jgi:hypothetical protein